MNWKTRPTIAELHRLGRILSALDLVLCYECPDIAYYTFTPSVSEGLDMVRLDNGAGDHAVGMFGPEGAVVKAFDHESKLSPYRRKDQKPWPGLYAGMPEKLLAYLEHEDFVKEDVTYCIYRCNTGPWCETPPLKPPRSKMSSDGSWLLSQFYSRPQDWIDWAQDYYEAEFHLQDVREIYSSEKMTPKLASALLQNVTCEQPFNFETLRPQLERLGFV